MKRQLKSNRDRVIKSPKSPRGIENKFGKEIEAMIAMMGKIYRNQVLLLLNAGTVEKFADAQTGNYAKVFLGLSNPVKRKLIKRFSNLRIDALVNKRLAEADKSNSERLYSKIEQAIGVSAKELAATEGMAATRNALVAETSQWIKKTRDETLEFFTTNSLRAMTQGNGLDFIMDQFDDLVETRKNHARFVAQNQINNYNSVMTKVRSQEIGLEEAIWDTQEDGDVRPSHADRHGKKFKLSEGCYSSLDGLYLLPATDYNCRCSYTLIIPKDEE